LLGPIHFTKEELARINQIIVGGENGRGARPMDPYWPRKVRDECEETGTAFFFKGWGEWFPVESGNVKSIRTGKKRAGRLLDGREHNDLIWAPAAEKGEI
jgi:protein gp37